MHLPVTLLAFVLTCACLPVAQAEPEPTTAEEELPARITRLARAGGSGAAEELRALLEREGAPATRRAILLASAQVGIRTDGGTQAVRAATASEDASVRSAAIETLGRLGDGRDMPALLGFLASGTGDDRSAALLAIRTLTDRRLSASPVRCRLWWQATGKGLEAAILRAIEETEEQIEAGRSTGTQRGVLVRESWVAIPLVLDTARRWLHSSDHRLRTEAFHLVAAMRLGETLEQVEQSLHFVNATDAPAAAEAARALGLEVTDEVRRYLPDDATQDGAQDE